MENSMKNFIENYISNMEVNVTDVGYAKMNQEWMDFDYTPNFNKLYFICDGEGWLKINGKEFYPKPGDLFLLPQGIKQSYSIINDNTFTKYWCHFTAKVSGANIFDTIHLPYGINIGNVSELASIFKELKFHFNSDFITSKVMVKSTMLKLLSHYFENNTIEDVKIAVSKTTEKIISAINYIETNFNKEITIEMLAKDANLHPNYFIRVFKKTAGTSPIHYVNNCRIKEAKHLLATTNMTLYELSQRVGTGDISYLSKLFKDYTGISPSSFRTFLEDK